MESPLNRLCEEIEVCAFPPPRVWRAVVSKRGVDDGNQKRWVFPPARKREPYLLYHNHIDCKEKKIKIFVMYIVEIK